MKIATTGARCAQCAWFQQIETSAIAHGDGIYISLRLLNPEGVTQPSTGREPCVYESPHSSSPLSTRRRREREGRRGKTPIRQGSRPILCYVALSGLIVPWLTSHFYQVNSGQAPFTNEDILKTWGLGSRDENWLESSLYQCTCPCDSQLRLCLCRYSSDFLQKTSHYSSDFLHQHLVNRPQM